MTYFEELMADISGRFKIIDERCAEVEETMSDLRKDLVRPFPALSTP